MQTITTAQIRDAFAEKIRAIVPTFAALSTITWSYTPSPRVRGRAQLPLSTRAFDLVFGAGVPLYRLNPSASWVGTSGTAYGCRLAVATSYAGIPPELLEHLVTQDAVDLNRALGQLRDPTLPGFSNAEPQGLANDSIDGEGNVQLEHVFQVHYHQATA